jgi:hypothetical protein
MVLLYIVLTATNGGLFNPPLTLRAFNRGDFFIHSGPIDNGTILGRPPKLEQNVNFHPSFDITLGSEMDGQSESVRELLYGFDRLVGDILDRFDHSFLTPNTTLSVPAE